MSIEKGDSPGPRRGRQRTELGEAIRELVEAAYQDPGEWYSMEKMASTMKVSAIVRYHVATVAAELRFRGDRLYIRFNR